jgi:hypothetical protein
MGCAFRATRPEVGSAVIEVTSWLTPPDWQPIATNPFVNGILNFSDPRPLTNGFQLYRIRL